MAVTKALIVCVWGGGGGVDIYSYIRLLPDEFLLKLVVITVDFKRNSLDTTRIYEYAPPPPINALVTALAIYYFFDTQIQTRVYKLTITIQIMQAHNCSNTSMKSSNFGRQKENFII